MQSAHMSYRFGFVQVHYAIIEQHRSCNLLDSGGYLLELDDVRMIQDAVIDDLALQIDVRKLIPTWHKLYGNLQQSRRV